MADVTLEEMESQSAEPEVKVVPKLSDMKLEAEGVPDHLKGKSVDDLMEQNRRLSESLRISEDARTALSSSARSVPDSRQPVDDQDEIDKLTPEQWEEMFKETPLKAMEMYEKRLMRQLGSHLDTRFRPLVDGAISSAEQRARAKYKDEFELFGEQFEALRKQVNPGVLATEEGWEDMVAYIRGKVQNFDKLVQKRAGRTPTLAREEQIQDVGFSATTNVRSATPLGPVDDQGLDEVQRKIAVTQFPELTPAKAYAEYKKWSMAG